MFIFYICFLILFSLFNFTQSNKLPVVILPKLFHLNLDEKISILPIDQQVGNSYQLDIRDSSIHAEIFYSKTFNLLNDSLSFNIKIDKYPSFGKAVIILKDLSTSKSIHNIVLVTKLNGIAIIQTDKPIYTPKQEIKVRVLRLDKNLRPINDDFRLQILNPQNIIMDNIFFNKNDQTSYFIDYQFVIPPGPIIGIWKVVLYQTPEHTVNTTFEVQEYILPTFDIELITNKFILKSTKLIRGQCDVRYTYNKPVNGSVAFKFGIESNENKIEFIGKTKSKNLVDGKASFMFKIIEFYIYSKELLFNSNFRFVVEVEVNEFVTGKKFKKIFNKSIFVNQAFKLSLEKTISNFKPGIENIFRARLLYKSDEPATDIPVEIVAPQIDIKKNLLTDVHGYFSLILIVDHHIDELTIQIKTYDSEYYTDDQLNQTVVLKKYQSATDTYIMISTLDQDRKIGEKFEADVILKGIDYKLFSAFYYYIVSYGGQILETKKLKYFDRIKFDIKNKHYPQITVIVIGYPLKHEKLSSLSSIDRLVIDSVRINVEDGSNNCGLSSKLFKSKKLREFEDHNFFEPGSTAILELKSEKLKQELSFIGVDSAVYALAANNLLVKEKFEKIYKENSVSCGLGGGISAHDVLLNTGLNLFNSFTLDDNLKGSHCKDSNKKIYNFNNKTNDLKRSKRFVNYPILLNNNSKINRKCCNLAEKLTKKFTLIDCVSKLEILKKYNNDTLCFKSFMNCCLKNSFVTTSYQLLSVSIDSSFNTYSDSDEFVHVAYEEEKEKFTYIRQNFKETWLFDIEKLEKNKSQNKTLKLTDSITSLSISIISVSKERGVCFFLNQPLEFITFKPLFLQVLLPYKAVQNEKLEMIVSVFNYNSNTSMMLLYFYGVEGICSEAAPNEKSERKQLIVPGFSSQSVSFPLIPLVTKTFNIKVVGLSSLGTDVVIKQLEVVPQGVGIEEDFTFQLDPKNKQKRKKRLIKTNTFYDRIYPEKNLQLTKLKLIPNQKSQIIVPNSEHCLISAIADDFGPATEYSLLGTENNKGSSKNGLDHLIRKPRGCGEQTAFYFAPTLYCLKYLQFTNRLNVLQKERALNYLRSGYKRQLMFRKEDGSFSAFPNRKSSVWLTSFIIKLFCVSSDYINLDNQIIKSGLKYIFKKQNVNGYWNEQNPILHKQLIGGVSGRIPLTAYILSTLKTCSKIEQINYELNQELATAIKQSENFLIFYKDEVFESKDAFKLAVLVYSLIDSYSYREQALEILNNLVKLATIDDQKNLAFWKNDYPIEVAAYILLSLSSIENQRLLLSQNMFGTNSTYSNLTDFSKDKYQNQKIVEDKSFIDASEKLFSDFDPQSIVNFLNSQKTFSGGFDSTQDTILALNALTEFYRNKVNSEHLSMNLNCNVTSANHKFKRSFQFNNENALVMRRLQLNKQQMNQLLDEEIQFSTSGNGLGVVSVKLKYNVLAPEKLCQFDLDVNLDQWRFNQEVDSDELKKNIDELKDDNLNNKKEKQRNENNFLSDDGNNYDDEETSFSDDLYKELNLLESLEKRRITKRFVKIYLSNNRAKNDKKINHKQSKEYLKNHFGYLENKLEEFDKDIINQIDQFLYEKHEPDEEFYQKNLIETKFRFKRSLFSNIFKKSYRINSKDETKPLEKLNINSIKISKEPDENLNLINDLEYLVLNNADFSSKSLYKLKICVQHLPQYDSEMTIIEIGLLTGFTVDKKDLDNLIANQLKHESKNFTNLNLIAKYEITGRSIILYLESVPFGRRFCFSIKLIQQMQVSNIQSAVIRVYDYYKKDDSCTTLYSPNRLIENLNISCSDKACTCATNSNCPSEKKILELGKIAELKMDLAREKFKKFICQNDDYLYVFKGKIKAKKYLNSFIFYKIELLFDFKFKNEINEVFILTLNQECNNKINLKNSSTYLFFLNNTPNLLDEDVNNGKMLNFFLNNQSMIFDLDENLLKRNSERSNVLKIVDYILNLINRALWKC